MLGWLGVRACIRISGLQVKVMCSQVIRLSPVCLIISSIRALWHSPLFYSSEIPVEDNQTNKQIYYDLGYVSVRT